MANEKSAVSYYRTNAAAVASSCRKQWHCLSKIDEALRKNDLSLIDDKAHMRAVVWQEIYSRGKNVLGLDLLS